MNKITVFLAFIGSYRFIQLTTLLLSSLIAFPPQAHSQNISDAATAHIRCYSSLFVMIEGEEDAYPDLASQQLEHERLYINQGLIDLKDRTDNFIRNGIMYRLGRYAEHQERLQKQRIYCDDPDLYGECKSLVWRSVPQIIAAARKFYQRENCGLLLK